MAKLTFAPRITRDRDSGDFLSEVVEWDGDQEVNVVFVGWFDTHALALSAANEEATDYYTKQAASELADEAVYCEECGVAVNPALAVLDGELMVCLGCGPCSAAEFEVMQMAEAERLMAAEAEDAARFASEDAAYGAYVEEHGHDPAAWPAPETFASDPDAWVAVSAAPCEPNDFRPVTTYLPDMTGAAVSQTGPACYRALWMGYYVGEPFATYGAAECEAVAAWAKANPSTGKAA